MLLSPNCIDRNDLIIITVNVLFFMTVQTLFFAYVASKQYEDVLVSKLNYVNSFTSKFPEVRKNVLEFRDRFVSEKKNIVELQESQRKLINWDLTKRYCGIPIAIGVLVLLLLIFVYPKGREWSSIDSLGLYFVAGAYLTELFFFFYIVRKYEFAGDQYILGNIGKQAFRVEK